MKQKSTLLLGCAPICRSNLMGIPLVSVIIPTYNQADFLKEALFSVCNQTFENWEAIVINNYSEDETITVVESFQDPRINLENFHNHGIIGASRNLGIERAKGHYIAFLDSDDFWLPEKLSLSIVKLNSGFDVVCHAEEWQSSLRNRKVSYGPENAATYESLLFGENCLSTSAVMAKRDSLNNVGCFSVDKDYVTAEDYDLWLKLARSGARIGFIDDVLGVYRLHESNESRKVLRNMRAVIAVVEKHIIDRGRNDLGTWIKKKRRYAKIYYGTGRNFQDSGNCFQAWPWFFCSILNWPFSFKLYVAMAINVIGVRIR